MLNKRDVSGKSSRGRNIMASARITSFSYTPRAAKRLREDFHHMEALNEESLLQDNTAPTQSPISDLPMQEALSESETQGDALFEQSFGDCQLYALADNNVNDATFHDDFPAPLPACEYLDMPTIFDKDISNNGVAYYIATENLLSLLMSALTTAASEICSHHEILSL